MNAERRIANEKPLPHSSFIVPHSSFLTHHSSFLVHRSSFIVPHSSLYLMPDLQTLNRESLVRLTVRGRKSGKPHTVKIWFTASNGKIYVTSARGRDADWVK